MNPEQLWETTMNPDNRVIVQITIEDAEKADEAFTILRATRWNPAAASSKTMHSTPSWMSDSRYSPNKSFQLEERMKKIMS